MWFISSQGLADRDNEDGVIGWNAQAWCLQELTFDLEVKGRCQGTKQVVGCWPQAGVIASKV